MKDAYANNCEILKVEKCEKSALHHLLQAIVIAMHLDIAHRQTDIHTNIFASSLSARIIFYG